ncbi:unnamed protein product [Penicillium bialowiezense]
MPRQRGLSNASSASSVPDQVPDVLPRPESLLTAHRSWGACTTIWRRSSSSDPAVPESEQPKHKHPLSSSRSHPRSCVLHRFVKEEWRVLSSQTIGVEFASRIVKLGTGPRRRRIKLQLWDTAGTERFRSVSRSYYRGAAGAVLIYDVASYASFSSLPTFLLDARALASPNLSVILAGNKVDLADEDRPPPTPSSVSSRVSSIPWENGSMRSSPGTRLTATRAEREVSAEETSHWAAKCNIPVSVEVSALTGDGVDEVFNRLARIILTKIELGEIDPDDPSSGIQYGDGGLYHGSDESIRSRGTDDTSVPMRRRRARPSTGNGNGNGWKGGMREWEDVFRLGASRPSKGCC